MDLEAGRAFLRSTAHPEGGWGYGPGRDAQVEPTSSVLIALAGHPPAAEEVALGAAWLGSARHPDGGWGIHRDDPESGWATAWAVQALAVTGGAGEAVGRGRAWLAAVRPATVDLDDVGALTAVLGIDPALRGWPWRPDEASWVEPTAHALLAFEDDDPAIRERAREAVRYLDDRRSAGGGGNFGNPYMFGRPFPARAHPTAVAVLALARWAHASVRTEDLEALRACMRAEGGAGALAWGLVALAAFQQDDLESRARLDGLQGAGGGWEDDPHVTALALRALSGGPA